MRRAPQFLRLTGRWLLFATVELCLLATAGGPLALPPVWRVRALSTSVRALGPLLGTVALLHLVLIVVGCYLLVLATLAVALSILTPATASGRYLLFRLVTLIALPGTRRLVVWSLGLTTLAVPLVPTGTSFAATSAGRAGTPPMMTWIAPAHLRVERPTMSLVPTVEPHTAPTTPTSVGTAPRERVRSATTPRQAPDPASTSPSPSPSSDSPVPTVAPSASPIPAPPPAPAPIAAPSPIAAPAPHPASAPIPAPGVVLPTSTSAGSWVVRPGDHLWSIAVRTLDATIGTALDERQIGAYWWQVVQTNQARLPDPTDIDLLYPSDVVTLPPLGAL